MAAILENHPLAIKRKVVTHAGLICFLLLVLVGYVFRSCGKQEVSKNNSFLTGARMTPPVLVAPTDTLNKDSLLQVEYGKFIDSVLNHTSIVQFNKWLGDNVSANAYNDTKFLDAINAFMRYQQQVFLSKMKK